MPPWLRIAPSAAALVLTPWLARAAEFCAPPPPTQGWAYPADGRVFHGSPTIERLRIDGGSEVRCQASADGQSSRCGRYRLRYAPWDPNPSQSTLLISGLDSQGAPPRPVQADRATIVGIRCLTLASATGPSGDRAMTVRTTRELLIRPSGPLRTVEIRESFPSSYPLLPDH